MSWDGEPIMGAARTEGFAETREQVLGMFDQARQRAVGDPAAIRLCGVHTGIASNRCLLPTWHAGPHDCQTTEWVEQDVDYAALLRDDPGAIWLLPNGDSNVANQVPNPPVDWRETLLRLAVWTLAVGVAVGFWLVIAHLAGWL